MNPIIKESKIAKCRQLYSKLTPEYRQIFEYICAEFSKLQPYTTEYYMVIPKDLNINPYLFELMFKSICDVTNIVSTDFKCRTTSMRVYFKRYSIIVPSTLTGCEFIVDGNKCNCSSVKVVRGIKMCSYHVFHDSMEQLDIEKMDRQLERMSKRQFSMLTNMIPVHDDNLDLERFA